MKSNVATEQLGALFAEMPLALVPPCRLMLRTVTASLLPVPLPVMARAGSVPIPSMRVSLGKLPPPAIVRLVRLSATL